MCIDATHKLPSLEIEEDGPIMEEVERQEEGPSERTTSARSCGAWRTPTGFLLAVTRDPSISR